MNNIDYTLFVYAKEGDVIVLSVEEAKTPPDGWKYTDTLDARRFIEYLCNESDKDILLTIKGLKQ